MHNSDSDPNFLISDGQHGIGFKFREEDPLHCRDIEGIMGDAFDELSRQSGASYSASDLLPEEFVITLALSRHWGSCFSPIGNGLLINSSYLYLGC